MARRSTKPRELVRLSPLQFSLSVSIVVVLLGAAGMAGYFYGLRHAARTAADTAMDSADNLKGKATAEKETAGSEPGVTFYTALTEPRKDPPVVITPQAVPSTTGNQVRNEPKHPVVEAVQVENSAPGGGSVILQVASYKNETTAQKLLQELVSAGYTGTVVRADLGERGVWFRVRIGPYIDENRARMVLESLGEERNLKGYIVKE